MGRNVITVFTSVPGCVHCYGFTKAPYNRKCIYVATIDTLYYLAKCLLCKQCRTGFKKKLSELSRCATKTSSS